MTWVRMRQGLLTSVLVSGLAANLGCMSWLHPICPPRPEIMEVCRCHPKCSRDHVYVFLINGCDPLDCANLAGLRDYVTALGFCKTYHGQLCHGRTCVREICRIVHEDPLARFVVIGHGLGADKAAGLVHEAKAHGATIDLLVYLSPHGVKNCAADQPENAGRIVNVRTCGCLGPGPKLDRAENVSADVGSLGCPSHPFTLQLLAQELAQVAAAVPAVPSIEEPPPAPGEEAPTPRPVPPPAARSRDEWDFLKPVSRLRIPATIGPEEESKPAAPASEKIALK